MATKRRTFHVDWDSPSHETGTVKRRPASLNAIFSASSNDRFENVEYYELRDRIDGYDLRLLKATGSRLEDSIATEDVAVGDDESSFVNEKCPGPLRPREGSSAACHRNGDREKFSESERARRARANERVSRGRSTGPEVGEYRWDLPRRHPCLTENRELCGTEIKDDADKAVKNVERVDTRDRSSGGKTEPRRNLSLSCEPLEWKSTVSRLSTKIRRSESFKSRSLIPRPKVAAGSCKTRGGLASSSSESSGFGSPLSPLSPLQQDPSISQERDVIRTSDSKSSGLGSPDSPLSPDSQKYSAFHLIQLQLEKLRNCPCEARQAKVIR